MSREKYHRICDPEFANSVSEMLSGDGSALHGGRWNTPGQRVVYLAETLSLAAYELLVHVPKRVLDPFKRLEVFLPEGSVMQLDDSILHKGWEKPFNPETAAIGDAWIASGESLALSVPSALLPGERNILLNPNHPDFKDVETNEISDFQFDARLAAIEKKSKK